MASALPDKEEAAKGSEEEEQQVGASCQMY